MPILFTVWLKVVPNFHLFAIFYILIHVFIIVPFLNHTVVLNVVDFEAKVGLAGKSKQCMAH